MKCIFESLNGFKFFKNMKSYWIYICNDLIYILKLVKNMMGNSFYFDNIFVYVFIKCLKNCKFICFI